jgi:hypothetical protein
MKAPARRRSEHVERPTGVTIIAVLAAIGGVFGHLYQPHVKAAFGRS